MLPRTALVGALAVAAVLAFASNALAVSGTLIKIAESPHNGPPAIAVDSAGTAYIAWANEEAAPYKVHYCTLPAGASACTHSGTLTPSGGSGAIVDNVQVLVDGSTVVLLADVDGVSKEDEPEQEWTSTDGGATFDAVSGGKSVANGILSADTEPVNAVIVPGTDALGYAWVTALDTPTFDEFPFSSSPPECSVKTCPPEEEYVRLQPKGSPNPLGNPAGSELASQTGANPGVLGVYPTLGKPGCASGVFDTAYVYGSGAQEANNSYDIEPGKPKSAWKVALSPADCEVEYPAVGGGPSGFGVVEDDLTRNFTVYHPFDQTHESFDTPYVTIATEGEESPSVSQDGSGNIYVTYLAGFEGEVRLAYSSNGGASWTGPASLSAAGGKNLVSSVSSGGQGWATWMVGEFLYAQQFVASDAIPPSSPPPPVTPAADTVTTSQTAGTATGASVTIPAGTVGETDRATISGAKAGIATGTVSYGLYSSSSCASAAKVFNGGTTAVSGGVAAASAGVSAALTPGTYYWQAVYSGDANNLANASACGSEVLTVTPAATIEGSGKSTSTTVTITITCASTPCTVTITITVDPPAASVARKKKAHAKTITLGTGKFTIKSKGPHKLIVHLTKAGRKYLAAHHGRLNGAKVLVSEKTAGGTVLTTRTIKITPAKPGKR